MGSRLQEAGRCRKILPHAEALAAPRPSAPARTTRTSVGAKNRAGDARPTHAVPFHQTRYHRHVRQHAKPSRRVPSRITRGPSIQRPGLSLRVGPETFPPTTDPHFIYSACGESNRLQVSHCVRCVSRSYRAVFALRIRISLSSRVLTSRPTYPVIAHQTAGEQSLEGIDSEVRWCGARTLGRERIVLVERQGFRVDDRA